MFNSIYGQDAMHNQISGMGNFHAIGGGVGGSNTAAPSMGVGGPLNLASRNIAGVNGTESSSFYKTSKD